MGIKLTQNVLLVGYYTYAKYQTNTLNDHGQNCSRVLKFSHKKPGCPSLKSSGEQTNKQTRMP